MRLIVLSLCMVMAVSACGIKPADVDPPQGEEKDYFPQTYPAPFERDINPERYVPR